MSNNSGFNPQDKFVNEVHTNTKSDLIEITEDKLEIILLKHLNKLNKVKGWLTPLSLFVTILIVLLTATFKLFAGLSKEVWKSAMDRIKKLFLCTFYKRLKFIYGGKNVLL